MVAWNHLENADQHQDTNVIKSEYIAGWCLDFFETKKTTGITKLQSIEKKLTSPYAIFQFSLTV
jgi:hypothetical protein